MAWFSCLRQQRKTLADDPHEIYEASGLNSFRIYSYKELGLATDNFNRANKIGEGGFGCVYKGKLNDGKMAAIKVLSAQSMQGEKEFLTELEAIGGTNHANLIKLFGCCVEENHRILVFGYIENNSLALTLLRKHSSNNARPVFRSKVSDAASNSNNVQFNWATRSKICIGIASGLEYLHEKMSPHIVHRDIKASNILLDKDLTPKISDFGLAKLLPPEMTHVSTRVAGTLGYLAPEYAVQGQLTRKADTYAFGVLILEIISGRCNKDFQLAPEEHYLLQKAWELYELRRLEELIDPALYGDCDMEEACIFLKIGLLCTQERPKLRPAMSSVVKMFRGEMEVTGNITRPGIIRDLKDLKVRGQTRTPNNSTTSSSASPLGESSSSSNSSYHQSVHLIGTTMQSD